MGFICNPIPEGLLYSIQCLMGFYVRPDTRRAFLCDPMPEGHCYDSPGQRPGEKDSQFIPKPQRAFICNPIPEGHLCATFDTRWASMCYPIPDGLIFATLCLKGISMIAQGNALGKGAYPFISKPQRGALNCTS
jgi:hypothetical protein